jgi:hypothetical protein
MHRNDIPHDPRHLVVLSGVFKMISEPVVRSTQTMSLSCINISTIPNGPKKHPFEPRHLEVPSGASKMISEPMVSLTHTMHLSCTNTNTVSNRTEMIFYMTHVTLEFHWVRSKRFMSLWYVRLKPPSLASGLALSSNRPNRAST